MNDTQTSASGLSLLPDGTGAITTIHLAIIAVLTVLAILGILWGIRRKRTRTQAARDVVEHAEQAGVAPEPAAPPARAIPPEPATQSQSQVQVAPAPTPVPEPVPVAPPPAPVADLPVVDTPIADTPEPIADEPIAASFDASPATELAPPAPAPTPATLDYASEPVTQLKGLGPKVAGSLAELGVTTIGQMAALSDTQAESIDAQLGAFTGRMSRDRWIEQARLLAAGDRPGFEAVFGKL